MRSRLLALIAAVTGLAAAAPAAAQQRSSGSQSGRQPAPATRALERSLGARAVVDVDPQTGTPRVLARLDGTLTGPRRGDPAELAQRYVRRHVEALGLTESDLGSLGGLSRVRLPGGGQQIRWRQYHAGVPALEGELRVTVTAAGAVLNVLGAPRRDLEPALAAPRLSAREAVRAAGAASAPRVVSGPSGARRTTRFEGGDEAALVLVGERLAWRVIHHASSRAVWDVVVDAGTGRLLKRANLVKDITVFERHPGAPSDGSYEFAEEGWLDSTARLIGPNAHAWADLDDSQTVTGLLEEVEPGDHPLFEPKACEPFPCTWDSGDPATWQANYERGTVQAFYYVNRFHDWLRDELQFTDGSFEGDDPVLVQTYDGAALDPPHTDNANMFVPPDGEPAVMQLYLFTSPDVFAGDDAAIVYHEYAHGLTNRLVTDGDGWGALKSPQAAAMGEGWSDYFAMDFLVEKGHQDDDPELYGEVDLDEYTQSDGRYQALDCPVAGCGGFTYADFGTIAGRPEIHADGEIWGQTLWDLRDALGPQAARDLVYAALPLSPPEPSFLDMRNAILLADQMLNTGANEDAIWEVFTGRGMGWFASTNDSSDVHPAASTAPLAAGQLGSVTGRVTDAGSGRPIAGAKVRVGGHDEFVDTAGADGAFSLGPLPAGTYGAVAASAPGGYDPETLADVGVPATGLQVRLKRNWVADTSDAQVLSVTGVGTETDGCQPEQAIDQDPGTGFSAPHDGSPPTVVLRLPTAVAVTGFGADPGNTCGDYAGSTTTRFAIAVSEDGSAWHEREYALDLDAAHVRNLLAPPEPGADRVRFVRLRMLASADPDAAYIDFTELSVYGNALPVAKLAVPATVQEDTPLTFDARAAGDPDGDIAQYRWDFDGNGRVDRTTASSTTATAYVTPGTYHPAVTVVDDRGGQASAATAVVVTQEPQPPPPPKLADPEIVLPRSGRRARVIVRVRCQAACTGTVRMTVARSTARRLRLGRSRTVASMRVQLPAAGERRVTVKLSRKAVRGLKRARLRSMRVSLSASVVDVGGRSGTARRTVRIRR
jgi:extracellular elastinolytic metalloproteinase